MRSLSVTLLSPVKVVLSVSGEKYALIKLCEQVKMVLNKYASGFCWERITMIDFFTGGSLIMDYGQK